MTGRGGTSSKSSGQKWKYVFEVSPDKRVYIGHDDDFYDDLGVRKPYHLRGHRVYDNETREPVGEILNGELSVPTDVLNKML